MKRTEIHLGKPSGKYIGPSRKCPRWTYNNRFLKWLCGILVLGVIAALAVLR